MYLEGNRETMARKTVTSFELCDHCKQELDLYVAARRRRLAKAKRIA
jgi:hypothetical protein